MEVSHLDHLQADFLPSLLGIRAETQLLSWLRRSRAQVCMCRRRSQRWPAGAEAGQASLRRGERRGPDCFTRSSSNPPVEQTPTSEATHAGPAPSPPGWQRAGVKVELCFKGEKNKSQILIVSPPNGRENKQRRQTRRLYRGADLGAAGWFSDEQEEQVC